MLTRLNDYLKTKKKVKHGHPLFILCYKNEYFGMYVYIVLLGKVKLEKQTTKLSSPHKVRKVMTKTKITLLFRTGRQLPSVYVAEKT